MPKTLDAEEQQNCWIWKNTHIRLEKTLNVRLMPEPLFAQIRIEEERKRYLVLKRTDTYIQSCGQDMSLLYPQKYSLTKAGSYQSSFMPGLKGGTTKRTLERRKRKWDIT